MASSRLWSHKRCGVAAISFFNEDAKKNRASFSWRFLGSYPMISPLLIQRNWFQEERA